VSIWDTFSRVPGAIVGGDTGDVACDQYHRYAEDVELMAELGIGAYRFSIAWPRIQPAGAGRPNGAGVDHYRRLVESLLAKDIVPIPTLFHWDLPQALEDAGGWPARDTASRFGDYAEIVATAVGDLVPLWLTVNEPAVAAWLGYGSGAHAPGRTDEAAASAAAHHLLLAHGHGVAALRAASSGRVGIPLNLFPCHPATDAAADAAAADLADLHLNRRYLDPIFGRGYPSALLEADASLREAVRDGDLTSIAAPIDVLGVNYYTEKTIAAARPSSAVAPDLPRSIGVAEVPVAEGAVTALGWAVRPGGLTDILERVHRDYAPPSIIVSENGAAFEDEVGEDGLIHDEGRVAYLRDHVAAVRAAADADVPVEGYLVWSLLDNFEWAHGYRGRFGIVHVDVATQVRTPKDSARWYRDHIAGAT